MGLDTMAGIQTGRQETLIWAGLLTSNGGNITAGTCGFLDEHYGVTAPPTPAGEFPTSYAGVPALTAPARLIALNAPMGVFNRWAGVLVDRLWVSGFMGNAGGTINSADMPARSNNGLGYHLYYATRSGVTYTTGMTPVVTYTNSDGVAGRVGTAHASPIAATAHCMGPIGLQAGDVGVKSVQSVSFTDTLDAAKGCQIVVARIIRRVAADQRERATGRENSALQKDPRGRLLSSLTPILPAGTVLTPSLLGAGSSAERFVLEAKLAYG